jgi:hypothetical protein
MVLTVRQQSQASGVIIPGSKSTDNSLSVVNSRHSH